MATKKVNGVTVELTPEEEQAILDQQALDQVPPTAAELDAIADAMAAALMEQRADTTRAIGLTIAEIVFRISNGTVPQGITEAQARTWVRDSFRQHYRSLF